MAANSKSGTSQNDRNEFLRDHGWERIPGRGKGDHSVWEHAGVKALAKKQNVECPANLLHNVAQLPWEHTVPDNPASGTWHRIAKHAVWAQETCDAAKQASHLASTASQRLKEFKDNRNDLLKNHDLLKAWRKEMKHRYKTGLDMGEARPAPVTYEDLAVQRASLRRPAP